MMLSFRGDGATLSPSGRRGWVEGDGSGPTKSGYYLPRRRKATPDRSSPARLPGFARQKDRQNRSSRQNQTHHHQPEAPADVGRHPLDPQPAHDPLAVAEADPQEIRADHA